MTTVLGPDAITEDDLALRIAYGGGIRELVDGCLVIRRPHGHFPSTNSTTCRTTAASTSCSTGRCS